MSRWLHLLGDAAPDILLMTVRALTAPGVAQNVRELVLGLGLGRP
jgi:hypothetical protein